ncbi:MAG: hypothetical protein M3N57_12740 [Actinomycetota bacterium]|nr:hypothetical protein [Actinomycetota bacterium]
MAGRLDTGDGGEDRGAAGRDHLGPGERAEVHRALGLAHRICDELRPVLMEGFCAAGATVKDDGSLITASDRFADDRITEVVTDHLPGHEVVSEERSTVYSGAPWCWVVDPVDGTTNFAHGTPVWCVSLALAFHGVLVLAVVDAPLLDRRYHAVRGEGAWSGATRLAVRDVDWSDHARASNALVGASSGVGRDFAVDTPLKNRALGSEALHLAWVADGSMAAAVLAAGRAWDVAAGMLLVEEAGGALVDIDGGPTFPLTAGTDYASHRHRFVAAASERTARRVRDGVRLL